MDPGKPHLLIAGKYQLVKELGRGAMGSVWEARHLTLRSPVAIKLMDPAIASSATGLQRFMREARAAAGLRSPHVVQVLDHGVDQGTPYIVMEKLEGESLARRLERVGKLSPRETARIVTHIARALSRAEQAGVTHRDLKPDNVFLVSNDDEELAKVIDFGIAKVEQQGFDWSFHEESTAAGALLGTPYYISPEQAEGLKTVDHRTDIWSLGVMTFECLLGVRPFEGETLPALLSGICSKPLPVPSSFGAVPHGFDAWFARACSRDLTGRFAFAKDTAAELARLCGGAARVEAERDTLPKLPTLPRLGAPEADDADGDPTEIWRGSLAALGIDPQAESKGGFSNTAKVEAKGRKRRWLALLGASAALATTALALSLAAPRATSLPNTANLSASVPAAQAPVAPSARALLAVDPVPQPSAAASIANVPSSELRQLPAAPVAARPAKALAARSAPPPATSASAQPVEANFDAPKAKPRRQSTLLLDTGDSTQNPYR